MKFGYFVFLEFAVFKILLNIIVTFIYARVKEMKEFRNLILKSKVHDR